MESEALALGSEWLSFHIGHAAGNQDRFLTERVRPTVRSLWQSGALESFFFLRHLAGGPHIRLRLRPAAGAAERVRAAIRDDFAPYLGGDLAPLAEIAFEPEIERYGGADRIGASLDFFALTSARALRLLDHRLTVTAGEWLTIALRLHARHLLGFAANLQDLESLLALPRVAAGVGEDLIRERADRAFWESGDRLVTLVRQEVEKLAVTALSPLEDGEVARRLAQELAAVDRPLRAQIFASQLHMTANRLGLAKAEEGYLGRILWHTFRRLEEVDLTAWSDLSQLLRLRAQRDPFPGQSLQDRVALAFATL